MTKDKGLKMNITPIEQNTMTFKAKYKAPVDLQDVYKFEQHIAPCFQTYEKRPIQGFYDGKSLLVFTGDDVKTCDKIKLKVFRTRLGQTRLKHTIIGNANNETLNKDFAQEEKNGMTHLNNFKELISSLVSKV